MLSNKCVERNYIESRRQTILSAQTSRNFQNDYSPQNWAEQVFS